MWATKSGAPDKAEFAEIDRRAATFRAHAKSSKIAVLPTRLGAAFDARSASRIAKSLQALGYSAVSVEEPTTIEVRRSANEMKLLWDFAHALGDRLRAAHADADYVLMGDFYVAPERGGVGAVHFVVCDREGGVVVADLQNEHHEDFERIAPKTVEDCERLLIVRLDSRLK